MSDSPSTSIGERPTPADTFNKMDLAPGLEEALEKMKISAPTAIQQQAIPCALAGNDIIGIAQTGSGKTLAYGLSLLTRLAQSPEARALVLTTSRETADQVYRVFMALTANKPFPIALVTTGVPDKTQTSLLRKNPRLIIASPGRLIDHLRTNKLLLKGLAVLVIDEADRMLELGFEPQLKFIHGTLRGNWQTLMFAASFGEKSKALAQLFLKPDAISIKTQAAEKPVETLQQRVLLLKTSQKTNRLLDELKKMKGGVIVFTDSQETCVTVGRLLAHHEFSSEFAHGNMNPGHRTRVLREFREQTIQILVTTDLLARGLDIPHVQHVVNFELPYKSEDFLHRIGRTARAGREGSAVTFITPSDSRTYRKIKDYLAGAAEEKLATDFKFEDR